MTGDFSQICKLVKSTNCQYLGLEAKNEKSKTTLFSQTFEVPENKVPLFFFHFWPPGRNIDILFFYQFIYLAKIPCQDNPCSLKIAFQFLKLRTNIL